jgi:hypothetical protein
MRLNRRITCNRKDHAPLVDFCNRWRFVSTTGATKSNPAIAGSSTPVQSTTSRVFTGQRPAQQTLSPTSFRRDRSQWKLVPYLIDSDTFCRKLVSTKAGETFAEG